ncbi:MAG TPA: septal ring lytic transglycosylase RlpA family protein [Acetobacteraceae bacterium]|jgi:rare lipoprotein A
MRWTSCLIVLAVGACTTPQAQQAAAPTQPQPCIQEGVASWYRPQAGPRRTADGERLDASGLTAAHRSLPFGTQVMVTNLATGRSVVVRINDRGPVARGRIIDLSTAAAKALDMRQDGVSRVRLEMYQPPGTIASAAALGTECLLPHTTES